VAKEKKDKKKTLGQELFETRESYIRENTNRTVGDQVDEIGEEEIMPAIWKQVEERKGLEQWKDKFYITVFFKRHPLPASIDENRVWDCFIQSRHTRPRPEPGLTLYSYDPKTNKLNLEWVLPRKDAFMTFLSKDSSFDPFLIDCIRKYIGGELE